ncbi:MAG TPA: hypothetical protein VNT54_05740 [Solirubrobacteraceae bacterium]|nr:hypothetical protein [Solirubrobacteraceae bacterium]
MSAQPPARHDELPPPGSIRCPRCSATLGPDQDWCLECGAPARTRLAPTPNWQLPTAAIGAMVLVAGALLAFAFVELTGDDGTPAGTTPTAVVQTAPPPAVVAPPAVTATTPTPLPTATTTAPAGPAAPATTVPGQPAAPPEATTSTTPARTNTAPDARDP